MIFFPVFLLHCLYEIKQRCGFWLFPFRKIVRVWNQPKRFLTASLSGVVRKASMFCFIARAVPSILVRIILTSFSAYSRSSGV